MENNKNLQKENTRQELINKVFSDKSITTIAQAMDAGLTYEEAVFGTPTWFLQK